MTVLAFDTSTAQGSVALIEGEKVVSQRVWLREKSHSEFLTAQIESVLNEAGTSPQKIAALAIGHGPGSFTGLRVTVNAAKALAYSLGIKVFTSDTGDILVEGVGRRDLPVITLINAQKNSFFTSRYEFQNGAWKQTDTLSVRSLPEIQDLLSQPHLCVGDGCAEIEALLPPDLKSRFVRDPNVSDHPLASILGLMSSRNTVGTQPLVWNEVQALYIRQSGAEEKIREGLKR